MRSVFGMAAVGLVMLAPVPLAAQSASGLDSAITQTLKKLQTQGQGVGQAARQGFGQGAAPGAPAPAQVPPQPGQPAQPPAPGAPRFIAPGQSGASVNILQAPAPQGNGAAQNGAQPGAAGTGSQGAANGQAGANGQAPLIQYPGQVQTRSVTDKTSDASGGVVRWLDKVSGDTADLTIAKGQSASKGRLTIKMVDCRYPANNPSSDAFAYLVIHDSAVARPIFSGWMIASSPALNPLDSARYDVWVLHCSKS